MTPRGTGTRPTSDRLRETLFNVLGPRLPGARFADLYAGSGAVGIEALSRGAVSCLFVERAPPALAAIRKNLATLGIPAANVTVDGRATARVLSEDRPSGCLLELAFLDPPYEAAAEYATTLDLLAVRHAGLLAPGALVIAEHARRSPLVETYGALRRTRVLEQGDAALSFYSLPPGEGPAEPPNEPPAEPTALV